MSVYLINIFLMVYFALWFSNSKSFRNWKKTFVIMASFQWIVLSGLRHISIGADTIHYEGFFYNTSGMTWYDVFDRFYKLYILNEPGKAPGYSVFEKISSIFISDYQVYLICIAILFTSLLGKWVYENSKDPFLSFIIYSCLFYAFFSITGHRQTIVTAFVVLIGFQFIKDRRFLPFLFLTLISFTIHKSALIFLPFYFLAYKKITEIYLASVYVLFIILFINKEWFSTKLKIIGGYEIYGINPEAGTASFSIIFIALSVVAFIRYKHIIRSNPDSLPFFNALLIALFFLPLTFVNPSAMRIVQYFSIFIILLIPEIIYSFSKRDRSIIYVSVTSLLILLLIRSDSKYLFFWE